MREIDVVDEVLSQEEAIKALDAGEVAGTQTEQHLRRFHRLSLQRDASRLRVVVVLENAFHLREQYFLDRHGRNRSIEVELVEIAQQIEEDLPGRTVDLGSVHVVRLVERLHQLSDFLRRQHVHCHDRIPCVHASSIRTGTMLSSPAEKALS